jgi:Trypsin
MKHGVCGHVTVAVVVVLVLLGTGVTHAIINGTIDGNRHPNVGVIVVELDGQKFDTCSGNLIAPTVFVTAAHCAAFFEAIGATQLWVTFDSHADPETSPLIPGTLYPNPNFDGNAPDPNDVAVITFADPVAGITPVGLPTPGLLDALGEKNGLKDQSFTVVGYGVHQRTVGGGPPALLYDMNRRYAASHLDALRRALLLLSMNASVGDGGVSTGDSGGPIFLGDSNTVVAIVGLGGDAASRAMYYGYRLDTPSARGFLANFVTLPD